MFKSLSKITAAMALIGLFVSPCVSATESDTVSFRQALANNPNVKELLPLGSNITQLTTKANGLFNMSGQLFNNEFVKEVPALCATEWQIQSPVVDLMSDKTTVEWRTVDSAELIKNPGILQRHTVVNAKNQEYPIFGSRCKDTFEWHSQSVKLQNVNYLSETVYITHQNPQEYILKSSSLKPPVEPADGIVPKEHFGKAYPDYFEMISWAATLCERKNGQLAMYPISDYRANVITSIDAMTTQWQDNYFVGCTAPVQSDSFLVKVFTEQGRNFFNGNPIAIRKIAFQRNRTIDSILSGK